MRSTLRAVSAALLAFCSTSALADTLVDNVQGETVAGDGRVEAFTAFRFSDDGTILAVYHKGDKLPRAQYRVDGKGRVLLPGLIDAHLHLLQVGFAALTLDLSETKSLRIRIGRGSSAAGGTRKSGGWGDSPAPPNSTQQWPIARSGWNASMATPAGATARR
jgi:hypothetical protein